MITTFKDFLHTSGLLKSDLDPERAYEIWSAEYDRQTGNLMLDLDEKIFSHLIENIDFRDKEVADIGCGTGRHWQKIYSKNPSHLIGFDVSASMLEKLKSKFPFARTQKTTDNLLRSVADLSLDIIISTLTIAHIKNIEEAIASWSRVLKNGGHLIVTDFHPVLLANGGKRSFSHEGRSLSVKNYVHSIAKIKKALNAAGFTAVREEEESVNEEMRSYYEKKNALTVYERFKGMPVIYGLHLRKQRAA
ncbi:MAG TPA: class I SAM-dependent methyltransferase [Puia sp.]|jgi:ubiquinone/menaquinone biosynthesis C-methylase UbiE|nr:class I SAM-dependent methyltransferase [Puia sp.]